MPHEPATTPRPDYLFKPGNPHAANRKGHKGARAKLASMVFDDVMAHWEEQGPGFLRRLAFHDMAAFASFVAKIMPQRIEHETATPFDHVDEALLGVSMRLAQAIAYLPDDDREMLGMLLDKAEMLASQKKIEGELSEEGVGAKADENFVGVKGTPLPLNSNSPDHQIDGIPVAAGATRESGYPAEAGARVENENVIDGDFEETE